MQFSQKYELKPAFLLPKSAIFRDNFSQNQEAKASSQLSEKNHWSLKKNTKVLPYTYIWKKTLIRQKFFRSDKNLKFV
jgi:hypothetical protein